MATGKSLHIGLNSVDAAAYGGWAGELAACEADAQDMRDICAAKGFQTTLLLTSAATSAVVLAAFDEAAQTLVDGDILVVSYSGHGGQIPDTNGDETDKLDETWVLYDRQVLDDELYAKWGQFAPGVRIVVFSDSCHSGSVVKARLAARGDDGLGDVYARGRFMPWDDNVRDNTARAALYAGISAATPGGDAETLNSRVLLLSGCQDNQTSADGERNGAFTGTLREVWGEGKYSGGYRRFLASIKRKMPPWQSPGYLAIGKSARSFDKEQPFTI